MSISDSKHTGMNPVEAHCNGKQAFDSLVLARQVGGRKTRRNGVALHPYRCPTCHKFHLSSRNKTGG